MGWNNCSKSEPRKNSDSTSLAGLVLLPLKHVMVMISYNLCENKGLFSIVCVNDGCSHAMSFSLQGIKELKSQQHQEPKTCFAARLGSCDSFEESACRQVYP